MKTYRIEHPWDNLGPYMSDGPYNLFPDKSIDFFAWGELDESDRFSDENRFPCPEEDGINAIDVDDEDENITQLFAFDEIDKLLNWFTKRELSKLDELGFKIYVYEVDAKDVWFGNKQCLFRKRKDTKPEKILEISHLHLLVPII